MEVRRRHGTLYDPYYESFFATKPLISLANGEYLAPHRGLVLAQGVEGLFDLCKENWPNEFGSEFGSAFEAYVGRILHDLPGVRVIPEKESRRYSDKKMCDYIIVGDGYILYLECKAVEYSAATSTEGAVRGDNSTVKIARAVDQLVSAATLAKEGELKDLLGDREDIPSIAAVVTFRHIYQANNNDYWDNAIMPHAKSANAANWRSLFVHRPQTLDVSELESLVSIVAWENSRPLDLFADKLAQSELLVGEWTSYLGKRRSKECTLGPLNNVFESFMDDILDKVRE